MAEKDCIRRQQEAYDAIKEEWPILTQDDQAKCLKLTGHTNDYRSIRYCVDSYYARRIDENRVRETKPFRY